MEAYFRFQRILVKCVRQRLFRKQNVLSSARPVGRRSDNVAITDYILAREFYGARFKTSQRDFIGLLYTLPLKYSVLWTLSGFCLLVF